MPNIGKKEKWVPFHTVLAPHEFFVVEQIHHNKDLDWTEYQRRLANGQQLLKGLTHETKEASGGLGHIE